MKRIVLAVAVLMLLLSSSVGTVVQQAAASQPAISPAVSQLASQPASPAQDKATPRYGMGGKISLPPPPSSIQPSTGIVDNRHIAGPNSPFTLPVFGTDHNIAGGNETSVAANPNNPLNFVAGANGTGRFTTTDGGVTWNVGNLNGGGDPAVAADGAGRFYFAELGNTGSCPDNPYVYKSTDGGLNWTGPVQPLSDPSPTDHFFDKEWISVDNNVSSPHYGRIYVTASVFHTPAGCDLNNYIDNREVVAYSDDQGATWSPTITISDASHNQNQFTKPSAASDGSVYISYQYQNCTFSCNGIPAYQMITKSTDGGVSWSPSITITGQPISYTGSSVAGYQYLYASSTSSGFRHNDQPVTAVSPTNPNDVYAIWSDGRFENTFVYQGVTGWHSDIVASHSTDGGATWSTPIKVNDDNVQGKDQFFPWLVVGTDGTLHASWMDRRDTAANGFPYREYYSQSTDGGVTWSANQPVANVAGTPNGFIGDYSGIAVNYNNTLVLPVWTDMRSGQNAYTNRGVIPASTPTPTVTGTPPTATPTNAATATNTPLAPTATPTPCGTAAGWSAIATMPTTAVRTVGAYYPPNGMFYSLGGRSADGTGNDLLHPYQYDPGTNSWTTKNATFDNAYVDNMAAAVLTDSTGTHIYTIGGSAGGTFSTTNEVRVYDPVADSISVLNSDPWTQDIITPNVLPGGFAVYNDKLFIFGGFSVNSNTALEYMFPAIWRFDPNATAGSRWTHMSAILPVPMGYVPAATIGNNIYTGGGATVSAGALSDTNNAYNYDPVNDVIVSDSNVPTATSNTRAFNVSGQLGVVGGGFTVQIPDLQLYSPGGNSWSEGAAMAEGRRNFAADTNGSQIWAAGGYISAAPSNHAEVYTPATSCASPTPAATNTPMATSTPIATSTMTPTNTPMATATMTATNTPAATSTMPVPSVTPTDCPNPFTDITGNIFYVAIHYLNCRGVVNGLDATHYGPAGTSTRGQFAKVVVLGFGTPLFTPTTQDFVDVPPSYFAYVYIESGFHAGILSGFDPATCASHGLGNPCYLPNLPITRGQLTKLVVNAGGYTLITPTGGVPDFVDVPPTNVFFVSIETAYHNGIVNGYPGHLFLPNANIRRDEMAQIVYEGILNRPH